MRREVSSETRLSSAQKRLAIVLLIAAVLPCAVAIMFSEAVRVEWSFDSLDVLTSSIHRSQTETSLALVRYLEDQSEGHWDEYAQSRNRMLVLVSAWESLQRGQTGGGLLHNATNQIPPHEIDSLDSEYARLKSLPSSGDSIAAISQAVRHCRTLEEIGDRIRQNPSAIAGNEKVLAELRTRVLALIGEMDDTDAQTSAALYSASKHLQSSLLLRVLLLAGGLSAVVLLISFTAIRGIRLAEREAYIHLARLEAVARNSFDAITLRDSTSRYLFMNHVALKQAGRHAADAIGLSPFEVMGEENGALIRQADLNVLKGAPAYKTDMVVCVGEEQRTLETLHSPVSGSDGQIVAVASIARDVTDQRKQEKHLRMLASALANAGDSIFISDAEFKTGPTILYANKAFLQLVGLEESEVIGKEHRSVFMPPGHKATANRILAALHDKGEFHGEVVVQVKNGKRLHLDLDIVPVFDGHGHTCNFVSVQRDITQKKVQEHNQRRLLQMLMNAQREERRRISIQLHDHAGQMLTSMLLRLAAVQNATREETVKSAIVEISNVASLTLEDISRLARGLYPAILDDLGLVEAIRRSLQDFEAAGIKASLVATGFETGRLPARLEGELYQIVQEALSNARKHSGARNVNVSLDRRKTFVDAIISDDGIGFDTDSLDRTLNSHLGLIGIRERASLLGGSLTIRSSLSLGTELHVNVPVLEPSRMVEVAADNA